MRAYLLLFLASGCVCGGRFDPGDRVLTRWLDDFHAGTVLEVQGRLVQVQLDTRPVEVVRVPADWLVREDQAPGKVEPGAWVLCRGDRAWLACRVETAGELLELQSATAEHLRQGLSAVRPLAPGVRAWVEAEAPTRLRKAELHRRLPGLFPRSAGKAAQPGQTVLAQWSDGHWWEATAEGSDGNQVRVAWKDGSGSQTLPAEKVAPVPDELESFEVGMGVICRWNNQHRWWRAVVDQRAGERLSLTWEDNTQGQVRFVDCVRAAE